MGGGRRRKGDRIDHAVGLKVHHRIGDVVEKDDPVLTVYCKQNRVSEHVAVLQEAVNVSEHAVEARPLVLHRQFAEV